MQFVYYDKNKNSSQKTSNYVKKRDYSICRDKFYLQEIPLEYLGINPYVLYSKGEEKNEETKETNGIFYVPGNDVSGAWHRKLIGGEKCAGGGSNCD